MLSLSLSITYLLKIFISNPNNLTALDKANQLYYKPKWQAFLNQPSLIPAEHLPFIHSIRHSNPAMRWKI